MRGPSGGAKASAGTPPWAVNSFGRGVIETRQGLGRKGYGYVCERQKEARLAAQAISGADCACMGETAAAGETSGASAG